ncbi:hypothetical protein F4778DRAFT_181676 [Xylariomycetidae sp. FL2044]|nr:hypothetical protein F4778DRAFT_181676 [Xylariomycetidae sp. FL2044]
MRHLPKQLKANADMKPSYLQRLPAELRILILSSIRDVGSLANAALTCHALYDVLAGNSDIIQMVLANCVGWDVLPEAMVSHQCSPPFRAIEGVNHTTVTFRDYREREKEYFSYIKGFLEHLERPPVDSVEWTMNEALGLANFHNQVVKSLVDRFVETCSASPLVPGDEALFSQRPVSQTEKDRIARALYRFEIYRKLFGVVYPLSFTDLMRYSKMFFSKFSPWENAQLGTIHEFLGNQIFPIFNDFARHDVVWGKERVWFNVDINDPSIQYYLSRGLPRIHKIVSCNTYNDLEILLRGKDMLPPSRHCFLATALRNTRRVRTFGQGATSMLPAASFFKDGDSGPQWVWNYYEQELKKPSANNVGGNHAGDRQLRHWGYVMWDKQRLDGLSISETPWQCCDVDANRTDVTAQVMEETWNALGEVYDRGGRGWWDEDDETRIEWRQELRAPRECQKQANKWFSRDDSTILDSEGGIRGYKKDWDPNDF